MPLFTFIVEDSNLILQGLSETLQETSDVRVVGSAATAEAAIDWLTGHSSDWGLVIVDLFLLRGTGLDVLRACRERMPKQHAIVLTNYATTEMRSACAELGADAVFDKSTEIDQIIDYCSELAQQTG